MRVLEEAGAEERQQQDVAVEHIGPGGGVQDHDSGRGGAEAVGVVQGAEEGAEAAEVGGDGRGAPRRRRGMRRWSVGLLWRRSKARQAESRRPRPHPHERVRDDSGGIDGFDEAGESDLPVIRRSTFAT